jgi:hypothetical protein
MAVHPAHLTNRLALASRMADEAILFVAQGKAVPTPDDLSMLMDSIGDDIFWSDIAAAAGTTRMPSEATMSATIALVFERVAA